MAAVLALCIGPAGVVQGHVVGAGRDGRWGRPRQRACAGQIQGRGVLVSERRAHICANDPQTCISQ